MHAQLLANKARQVGLTGEAWTSVTEAKEAALKAADMDDLVFIGGSAFVVAEVV